MITKDEIIDILKEQLRYFGQLKPNIYAGTDSPPEYLTLENGKKTKAYFYPDNALLQNPNNWFSNNIAKTIMDKIKEKEEPDDDLSYEKECPGAFGFDNYGSNNG